MASNGSFRSAFTRPPRLLPQTQEEAVCKGGDITRERGGIAHSREVLKRWIHTLRRFDGSKSRAQGVGMHA
eukprot:4318365-Pyramimonas_sp.AAC.1